MFETKTYEALLASALARVLLPAPEGPSMAML